MRRRYLVAYDIRDPKRLREVFTVMKGFGEHVQYSVFLCDLDGTEKPLLLAALAGSIKHTEDSVVIVDLGEATGRGTGCFEFLGIHRPLPTGGPMIV
jgi:CRISPR-associated protein Cas2